MTEILIILRKSHPCPHTNTVFPADSFSMPPNFAVPLISGWHLSFPLGLTGRRFPGEEACKSHPPFNLHTFRPPLISSVQPSFSTARCSPSVRNRSCFRQIATPMTTGGNKSFRLPIRTHQFHSSKGLEGYCRICRNTKKRSSFDKTPCPCFSYCQLCCHSTQTSACNAIPACFQLIVTGLLSQVFFLSGFYKPFLLS